MTTEHKDVVIIGGGPAGMTAAMALQDKNILLLEASERLGGRLHSLDRGDYWMNLGGHLFPGASSHIGRILQQLNLRTIPIPGSTFGMAFKGKVYNQRSVEFYPFVLPMTIPERIGMVRVGLKLMKSVFGRRKQLAALPGETQAQRRLRLASYLSHESLLEHIGNPPERVLNIFRATARRAASEIDQQSAGVGVSLFGAVWSGKKSEMALNLYGGSGKLAEAVTKRLGDLIKFQAAVTSVKNREDGLVEVDYELGGQQHKVIAQHVVMATPAMISSKLVQDLPADLRNMLDSVSYGSFLSMGVITSERTPMPYDNVYAITTPDESFDMLFNHANPIRRPGTRAPGGSLMMYSGGAPAAELMKYSDDQVRDIYLRDLFKLYPGLRGHIAETQVQRWEIGNTYHRPGMDFSAMTSYCDRSDTRVHFCGDYFAELGNMEVAAESAMEAVERIRASLQAAGK